MSIVRTKFLLRNQGGFRGVPHVFQRRCGNFRPLRAAFHEEVRAYISRKGDNTAFNRRVFWCKSFRDLYLCLYDTSLTCFACAFHLLHHDRYQKRMDDAIAKVANMADEVKDQALKDPERFVLVVFHKTEALSASPAVSIPFDVYSFSPELFSEQYWLFMYAFTAYTSQC